MMLPKQSPAVVRRSTGTRPPVIVPGSTIARPNKMVCETFPSQNVSGWICVSCDLYQTVRVCSPIFPTICWDEEWYTGFTYHCGPEVSITW